MVLAKLSFAWFLLRVTITKTHSYIIYTASLFTIVAGTVFFFVTFFQCLPVSYFWNKDQKGRCMEMHTLVSLAYLYSAFSILTDFTFAILPAFLIWNLALNLRTKGALIALITMGCMYV